MQLLELANMIAIASLLLITQKQKIMSEQQPKYEVAFIAERGTRHNEGKRKWSLVHFKSLEPMIEVLEFGAGKYGAFNWQKGLDRIEILESMMRHIADLIDGETHDKESGKPHMGHIQANAMFYNYFNEKE